jgi:uncharacterized membrane protein
MDRYIQPVSRFRNWSTIAFIVVTNSFGNLLLALGMNRMPPFMDTGFAAYVAAFLKNPWILAGVVVLAAWMYAQLAMLTWSDLSYLMPMTASGYVLTALLSVFVLGESISVRRWTGIALISFGVLLVAETPPKTVHDSSKGDSE